MSPAIRKARKNAIEEQKSWKRASAKGWYKKHAAKCRRSLSRALCHDAIKEN